MNEDKAALQAFRGEVRLFPLPNLVFFPHALQPLHIFEPRYRQLTADALSGDRLIALVLLQPGSEASVDTPPAIHQVASVGRIIADQLMPDGRSNLLLRGLSRIRIIEEIPSDKLYRSAHAELIHDRGDAPVELLMDLRKQLEERILPRFNAGPIAKQLLELFRSELPLGALCDVLAFALPIPNEWKQKMLEEPSEDVRANMLLDGFEMIAPPQISIVGNPNRKFPPDFSSN
jgi:uncharacterized protein